MNIGFDAKRAFHNTTGLGYYSRTITRLLATHFPEHQYFLFNPGHSSRFALELPNMHEINPSGLFSKIFSSAWRSKWVTKDLERLGIDVYNGLSHEIPIGIGKTKTRSVVTIHDLIHERFPHQYKAIDRKIYTRKYTYACRNADHVIAISQQTKQDLVEFYKIDPAKITVVYQSGDPIYAISVSEEMKGAVSMKYNLPSHFILSVGTINERKNLLNVCKAMFLLRNEMEIPPLVVIGKGKGEYYQSVKNFVLQHGLDKSILFLSERPGAKEPDYLTNPDLAAIYQLATVMIYPSFFEGFGVPILEALHSELPVITANTSCLPEVGGDAALYVDPNSAPEMADAIRNVITSPTLAAEMKIKGKLHAQRFSAANFARDTMNVYKSIC